MKSRDSKCNDSSCSVRDIITEDGSQDERSPFGGDLENHYEQENSSSVRTTGTTHHTGDPERHLVLGDRPENRSV